MEEQYFEDEWSFLTFTVNVIGNVTKFLPCLCVNEQSKLKPETLAKTIQRVKTPTRSLSPTYVLSKSSSIVLSEGKEAAQLCKIPLPFTPQDLSGKLQAEQTPKVVLLLEQTAVTQSI